ncbi:phage integrase [Pseudomonas lopnurensis]|uniref:phage integrase n=1 Tax=Pseudomonas lopnurensis TaxID=1477517 RepID=UPI0028A5F8DC|nr:hypothetical protein [Pseudomonas lopnurensis]
MTISCPYRSSDLCGNRLQLPSQRCRRPRFRRKPARITRARRWPGARGAFEKKPKRDERLLSDLITLWFNNHGRTLKRGEERERALQAMATRMGDPRASDFTTSHFTQYRADRLAGKFGRETAGSGRKKGEKAKPVSANTHEP